VTKVQYAFHKCINIHRKSKLAHLMDFDFMFGYCIIRVAAILSPA